MSTAATPPGPPVGPPTPPPASPPPRKPLIPNIVKVISGIIVIVVIVAVILGVIFLGWFVGSDNKQLNGPAVSAPVDTTNAPPVPSISETPTPTPVPTTPTPVPTVTTVYVTPAPSTAPTTTTAPAPVVCPSHNPNGSLPPRTIEAPRAARGQSQAAACNFAAMWEYQATLPIARQTQAAYNDAVKVCKSRARGETAVRAWAKVYKTDARAFYVAAVTTLCNTHDGKQPVLTQLDRQARAMRQAFDTSGHNPPPIKWITGKSDTRPRGVAPTQAWVYGQFIKTTCGQLKANGDDFELRSYLTTRPDLRLLSYDSYNGNPGYDDGALRIFIDQAVAAGCPSLG